ncbi:UDP-glycosyltransferase 89A2-like [Malania oleifera]|uniref:UDP-glycosyltransferase 89A2-like n=1 Tax=Malania oleifera TaxID=397392 RepID=UPI0025ADA23F|nr:UDP-glycosyltransferase 89A2-like [Malania oleifera]
MSNSGDNPHILVFPYPAQGHMLPLLDLTRHFLLRGLAVTVVVTPKNLPLLRPLLSAHPSLQTLVLPFPPHPSLPAGTENVRDVGNHGNIPIMAALGRLHSPISDWVNSHPSPPLAIVSDFFLGWTVHLAADLGIPRIAFYSSGAFLSSVSNYLWLNINAVRSSTAVEFSELPRSPSFAEEHLPSVFRNYRESDPDWELIKNGMIANCSSWGCVFNTFDALEGEYLEHLKKTLKNGRIYGIGPLSLMGGAEPIDRTNPDSELGAHVLPWLDGQPDGSVLYVCFGSQKLLKRTQLEALASGLERSGTRFVWVVKSGMPEPEAGRSSGAVPDGFEERVAERGMVIRGWAPQKSILSHRAVSGFLSHCGWNSMLEGIGAGVLILGWPMEADQFVNARLLVEDMGAAVQVCEGEDAVPDSAELARTIAESMSEDVPQRKRAEELRAKAFGAVEEGGSSFRDLHALVKELAQLHQVTEVHRRERTKVLPF